MARDEIPIADVDALKAAAAEPAVLTVFELTSRIKTILEGNFKRVFVKGEISNFTSHHSGHYYFTLKDDKAQIPAVMFRYQNKKLKFTPEHGMEVILIGRLSVYEPHGKYQILVDEMEPAGLGALQKAFEQLRARLEKEGLFDPAHKKPIPKMPQRIGIVTSPTGAAIRDILNITRRRYANIHIVLYPVRVQGEGAAQEVAQAIDEFNTCFPEMDVLIVGRGGGSLEDLWAFNEEAVARSIYASKIPIISAVGHEVDTTIADYVADLRAPTPSAAAELVVQDKIELLRHLENLRKRLVSPLKRLDELKLKVDHAYQGLCFSLEHILSLLKKRIEIGGVKLNSLSPVARLAEWKRSLALHWGKLRIIFEKTLGEKRQRLKNVVGKLEVLSPLAILSRGYSITKNAESGQVIAVSCEVAVGDEMDTILKDGSIRSKVLKTVDNHS